MRDRYSHYSPMTVLSGLLSVLIVTPRMLPAQVDPPGTNAQTLLQADPGYEIPFLTQPTQPDELIRAVLLSLRLARPELAKVYLDKVLELDPDDATLLQLRDQFGSAEFLRLARMKSLQPASRELLQRMNGAFQQIGADATRVSALIDKLSGSTRDRRDAIRALRDGGVFVIPALLRALGDPETVDQRDLLVFALTQLGRDAVPALLGALESPSNETRSLVAQSLGRLGDTRATAYLWYPAFSADQPKSLRVSARNALKHLSGRSAEATVSGAAAELRRVALEHFRNEFAWGAAGENEVHLWTWRDDIGTVTVTTFARPVASLRVGLRLARQALALSPQNADSQELFLALALAHEAHGVPWDQPLPVGNRTAHDLAVKAGPEMVERVLELALGHGNQAAARAALQILGLTASGHAAVTAVSPVVSALNYPDGRLQFAAANCLMNLGIDGGSTGAGRVVQTLARSLNNSGSRRCLVIDPNEQRAQTTSGLIGDLNFETQIAVTGRDGFRIAAARTDVEMIAVNANCQEWALSETIANLRADVRTRYIPIIIYGPEYAQVDLQRLAQRYPLIGVTEEARTSQFTAAQFRPLMTRFFSQPFTASERDEQTQVAAFWLAHIARSQHEKPFDLTPAEGALFAAVTNEDVAADCLAGLSAVSTPSARHRLFDVVTDLAREPLTRQLAAVNLAHHLRRYGGTLKNEQREAMRALAESESDPFLSTAFASVVGALKPTATRVLIDLRQYAAPGVN